MILNRQNYNSWFERILYFFSFLKFGIILNPISGKIRYLFYTPKCKCKRLQVMRHGRTIGVENKEFMSNTSINGRLSQNGKREIKSIAETIESDLPDIVIVSTLYRTLETYNVLQQNLSHKLSVQFSDEMKGINNSIWEGKTFEMLDENNLLIFLQRECEHNVIIKTNNGDSWADVIYRCSRVLSKINKSFINKKVLLISQGSIYQGLKILLHADKEPWRNYSASKMFNLSNVSTGHVIEYSSICEI